MSYYDEASLVMIPSGYKTSKVYSIKPTDGSGDLAFTRSNDTATRVGPDGLIEKVRTNFVLQSNQFDTTWTSINTTETIGAADFDGGNNAWTLAKSASSAKLNQNVSGLPALSCFSIYAKAGTLGQMAIETANRFATFNLSTGVVVSGGGVIESVGGGWYRCSVTDTVASTGFTIYPAPVGDTSGNIIIYKAQVEAGDIATDYIATTTAAVSVGPVANVPRLDYLNSSCPRLLLEGQRQNVITFSEQMDNAAWTKTNVTITANSTTSPDGYTNADTITSNSAAAASIFQTKSIASSTTYTASVFVKKDNNESRFPEFTLRTEFTSYSEIYVQLNTKTGASTIRFQEGTVSKSVESFGDYWRVSLIVTNIADAQIIFRIAPAATNVFGTFNPQVGSIIAYGAQLEAGAYATSYIPTLGAAVTRGADAASKTGISSLIGASEYTMYWEGTHIPTSQYNSFMTIYKASDLNSSARFYRNNTNNEIRAAIFNSVSGLSLDLGSGVTTQTAKCALRVKAGSYALYVNGALVNSSTSALAPASNLDAVNLQYYDSSQSFDQKTAQVLFFKTALSNADLAALTA
jgi:hypothetical protein